MIENNSELLEISNIKNFIYERLNFEFLIKVLIRTKKFDFTSIDSSGDNLLHYALKNEIEIESDLIDFFDVNQLNPRGESALILASINNNYDTVKTLTKFGANID